MLLPVFAAPIAAILERKGIDLVSRASTTPLRRAIHHYGLNGAGTGTIAGAHHQFATFPQ
jgi:hypothetical protein